MTRERSFRGAAAAFFIVLLGLLLGWIGFGLLAPGTEGAGNTPVAGTAQPGATPAHPASAAHPTYDAPRTAPDAEPPRAAEPAPEPNKLPPHLDYPPLAFVTRTGPAVGVPLLVTPHGRTEPMSLATNVNGLISLAKLGDLTPLMKLDTTEWRVVEVHGMPAPPGWFRASPGLPVVLERSRKLQLHVRYADGQPYEGPVRVATIEDEDEGPPGIIEEVAMLRGEATITVSEDAPTSIGVWARRPGFKDTGVKLNPAEPLGKTMAMVLDTVEPTTGVIEIDLSVFPADSTVTIAARCESPGLEYRGEKRWNSPGGRVFATTAIEPGDYILLAWQDVRGYQPGLENRLPPEEPFVPGLALTWQAGGVRVIAGETTRVFADAIASAAVKARIVDGDGLPLWPSRLFVDSDHASKEATNWTYHRDSPYATGHDGRVVTRRPSWGQPDKNGVATIPRVAPGRRVIAVESPGLEMKLVEVDLPAGTLVDLGEIALTEPASGMIEVEIVNYDPNESYVIHLSPYMRGTMEYVPMKGARHRIQGLALRWYAVSVNMVSTKMGAYSQNVKLSRDRRRVLAKFEMLPPPLPWPPEHLPQEDVK